MTSLANILTAALVGSALGAAILVVAFPPPKSHPGNHRGTPAPEPVRPVLVLPAWPQTWPRAVGRVHVPEAHAPRHAAPEAVSS